MAFKFSLIPRDEQFFELYRATTEQIRSAAELDTEMLSKPLPPAAYSDPGFREYLNEAPNDPSNANSPEEGEKSDEAKSSQ